MWSTDWYLVSALVKQICPTKQSNCGNQLNHVNPFFGGRYLPMFDSQKSQRGPTFGLGGRTEIPGLHSFVGPGASKTLGASINLGVRWSQTRDFQKKHGNSTIIQLIALGVLRKPVVNTQILEIWAVNYPDIGTWLRVWPQVKQLPSGN